MTVNMFDTVFNEITRDCHANGGDLNTTLDDYKETLCPILDKDGTDVAGDITEPDKTTLTFTFGMKLALRAPMKN